ncbi:MAG: hypothetical protein AAF485_16415, partial [Chloroflexota bacterium]
GVMIVCVITCGPAPNILLVPTPTPSSELLDLPKAGVIQCYNDQNLDRGAIVVWELPGLPPVDDSEIEGYTGRALGGIKPCSVITVTNYSWSQTDQKFYIYVKSNNSEDWAYPRIVPLEGWVSFDLIALIP